MWDAHRRLATTHPELVTLVDIVRSPAYADLTFYPRFVFTLSKIAEFGDTVLILLRGRPLRFIQWYHHVLTYVYAYMEMAGTYSGNSAVAGFVVVNAIVHTIMYGWYAFSTAGFRTPAWFKHMISLIQVVQMFFGCWLIYIANHKQLWRDNDPVVYFTATGMYGSYIFLFGNMLLTNVFGGGKKSKKE